MTIQVSALPHMEWGSHPGIRPSSTEPSRHPSLLLHKPHRRQQSMPLLKQASLTASLSHGSMPPNTSEWKNTMDEVKRKYIARKYRSCSMQCCEILESLKDTSAIEPLHRIYLHFYAASSFEWCARPLSPSTYRDELLRSSQTHYAQAEDLIAAMEGNMTERASSPTWVTSPSSPSLSTRSRTPDLSSTASSSPRTSAFFLDDPPTKPARQSRMKSKKKVSFSSLPQLFEFQPEPYIRPDSPTLGWEDPFCMASNHEIDAPFPVSPKKHSNPISIIKAPMGEKSAPARIMTIAEFESRSTCNTGARNATASARRSCDSGPMNPDYDGERCSTPSNHTFDLEAFIQTRSLNRFRGQLSALRDQVCRHRAVVDNLLTSPTITPSASEFAPTPEVKPLNPIPAVSHTRHQSTPMNSTTPTRSSQPSNALRPTLRIQTDIATNDAQRYHHLRRYNSVSAGLGPVRGISSPVYVPSPRTPTPGIPASPLSAGGDVKNLQNRIERLRASGWQRKRFDNRRYEALREQVLGELEPCR
ncbi:hypothetical protein F5Y08DRAFT_148521 [Xylaria arbuscula]|nr:hypothetical protein F5Y08DRAFT_148521 [Xylaria arbuscula]